jgi:DNA-directed RNA polymerase specialized sigma24 family protein
MFPIQIPTNQEFLKQYYAWTHAKVSRHFKRDKERMMDTVQNVRLRLLSKDFIGRWFFKHLTDELVDRTQAESILGGAPLTYISYVSPVEGKRSDQNSLWMISDILRYAKFDYSRYYYSPQGHTIDTARVLRLLGYSDVDFGSLQSLYRQGRLLPSEMTEHVCSDDRHSCTGCKHGKELLYSKGLSLAHNWTDLSNAEEVLKLRWNDNQLKLFLRDWRRSNLVKSVPRYIMRKTNHDVTAGLLKYAQMVIDNEVVNDFKRMSRSDDTSIMIYNNGVSPEYSDDEIVSIEKGDDENGPDSITRSFRDPSSMMDYERLEKRIDLINCVDRANLSQDEHNVLVAIDVSDIPIRKYASSIGVSSNRVNKLRTSAINKLRNYNHSDEHINRLAQEACNRNGCDVHKLLGDELFGAPVKARTDFFNSLNSIGMSPEDISSRLSYPIDRVVAALNRAKHKQISS